MQADIAADSLSNDSTAAREIIPTGDNVQLPQGLRADPSSHYRIFLHISICHWCSLLKAKVARRISRQGDTPCARSSFSLL